MSFGYLLAASAALVAIAPASAAVIVVQGNGTGQAFFTPFGGVQSPSDLGDASFSFSYVIDLDTPGGVGSVTDTTTSASTVIAGGQSILFSFSGTGSDLLSGGTGIGTLNYVLAYRRGGGIEVRQQATTFTTTRLESYDGPVGFLGATVTAAIPEPATWAAMIAGFALIGTRLRQRQSERPTHA